MIFLDFFKAHQFLQQFLILCTKKTQGAKCAQVSSPLASSRSEQFSKSSSVSRFRGGSHHPPPSVLGGWGLTPSPQGFPHVPTPNQKEILPGNVLTPAEVRRDYAERPVPYTSVCAARYLASPSCWTPPQTTCVSLSAEPRHR